MSCGNTACPACCPRCALRRSLMAAHMLPRTACTAAAHNTSGTFEITRRTCRARWMRQAATAVSWSSLSCVDVERQRPWSATTPTMTPNIVCQSSGARKVTFADHRHHCTGAGMKSCAQYGIRCVDRCVCTRRFGDTDTPPICRQQC